MRGSLVGAPDAQNGLRLYSYRHGVALMEGIDTPMALKAVLDRDDKGVRVLSFPRDSDGMCNLDQVRSFFANDFLDHVAAHRRLIIDLAGIASLDSSCLGPLVQKMREIKDLGGRLVLVGVDAPALQEIFALTRFDKVFPIYKTVTEALPTFT